MEWKIGLVGCGRISPRHIQVLKTMPGFRLAGVCDLPVPGALAGSIAVKPGALFLVLSLSPPAAPVSYGTVSLEDDGTIRHNGAPVVSLIGLADSALAGRGK